MNAHILPDDDDFDPPEMAYSMSLTPCTEACAVHIILFDADGVPFAGGALNRSMATYWGKCLTRIGAGEEVKAVLADERKRSLT